MIVTQRWWSLSGLATPDRRRLTVREARFYSPSSGDPPSLLADHRAAAGVFETGFQPWIDLVWLFYFSSLHFDSLFRQSRVDLLDSNFVGWCLAVDWTCYSWYGLIAALIGIVCCYWICWLVVAYWCWICQCGFFFFFFSPGSLAYLFSVSLFFKLLLWRPKIMFSPLICSYFLICHLLLPFVLMEVIMLSGPRQLNCFFLVERSLITWLVNPLYLRTLNLLIGELKMHKLGVACGIAWSLRSIVVWFSYQLLNLFGNRPRNFTLALTIWSRFMIFIKIISPWVWVICLWLTIITSLGMYGRNSIFISPSPLMLKQ